MAQRSYMKALRRCYVRLKFLTAASYRSAYRSLLANPRAGVALRIRVMDVFVAVALGRQHG